MTCQKSNLLVPITPAKRDLARAQQAEKLQKQGRGDEAEVLYVDYLKDNPDHAIVWHNLGVLYQRRGDAAIAEKAQMDWWFKAADCYEKSICLPHEDIATKGDSMNNLGDMMTRMGHEDKAAICFTLAAQWNPRNPVILENHAHYLMSERRFKEAEKELARSLQLDPSRPESKFNRGVMSLLLGDWKRGWKEYEWRWSWKGFGTKPYETNKPRWKGEDVQGKTVLITAEQGFGDSIQFIRYVKMVKARGATVLWLGHELLADLFKGVEGIDRILKPDDCFEFDYHTPLLSLPRIFETRLENVPCEVPYILNRGWERFDVESSNGNQQVGICWAGSPRHAKDRARSFEPERFAELVKLFPRTSWVSLQIGPRSHEVKRIEGAIDLSQPPNPILNFTDTAQVLETCDLVISADTSVIHLAGALGRPVWALIPFSPDWRWMLERETSPWYPTMRLFRQPKRGDWDSVFERVKKEFYDSW